MKTVMIRDGVLEIRWTWLPFWLATNPKLKTHLETEIKDLVALNGLTGSEEDLRSLHDHVIKRLQTLFPSHTGLNEYLDGLKYVHEPV